VFGVGALIGELSAPFLRRWPVWPIMTGIVIGWGLAIVPLGLATPLGARGTLLTSGVATIVLGLVATAVLLLRRAGHAAAG
jgi:DHA3 family macrolide efflux protein-like MFS transporter